MNDTDAAFEGSCLCGEVRYRAIGPLGRMGHCHCVDCRKAHGAAFATFVDVVRERLVMLRGEGLMRRHRARSGSVRAFCGDCGSLLTWERDEDPGTVSVAVGTFDTPPDRAPEYHIFVRSKLPWIEIRDGLPQFAAYPEPEG
jgi:hypothetical protein